MNIQEQILHEIKKMNSASSGMLAQKIGISRQAIHKHLQNLLKEGKITSSGSSKKGTRYFVKTTETAAPQKIFHKKYKLQNLQEDLVLQEIENQPNFLLLPPSIHEKFRYTFTEMLNNAIDHSKSKFADVRVEVFPNLIAFQITDQGIGIFENIKTKMKLKDHMEAIQDLLKGKQTTQPEKHTGEGIFFTSKISDLFVIESSLKLLIIDNEKTDLQILENLQPYQGTRIHATLHFSSPIRMREVFEEHTTDYKFEKTKIIVKIFEQTGAPISRSQAKRVLNGLEKFREVVLDFDKITQIGQGFTDEVFRVFAGQHPNIRLIPIHAHENVLFMIKRSQH